MGSPTKAELLAELTTLRGKTETLVIENARLLEVIQREQAVRTRAEEALLVRTQQLEAVRVIGEEIIRELDLPTLLDLVTRRSIELVGASSGTLRLWDEDAQILTTQSMFGVGERGRKLRFRLGEGVAGTVAQRREGLIVNDFRKSPYATPTLLELTTHAAVLGEPLLYRDRLIGVITIVREEHRPFTEEDRQLLGLFAGQAAIAIENARLHGAAVRRGSELEALVSATRTVTSGLDLREILDRILAEAVRISGAPHVKVLLLDKAAGVLRVGALKGSAMPPDFSLPVGVGSSGLVAQTGDLLFMADPGNDPRSIFAEGDRKLGIATYLGLPIKRGDEVLGVLTFNTAEPRKYSPDELALLTSFADHAAVAIEKAQLFQELNESYAHLQQAQDELIRAEKLRALGQMSAGIAHDLNNTLAAILGQVELLGLRTRDPEVQETLRILEMAATDGAQVVRRLQDFARQQERSPLAPVDLAQVVSEVLEITRPRWRDELQRHGQVIDIRVQLEGVPPILGYAPEVREVLTNLILNAVDAMSQGGTLSFTAREVGGGDSGDQAIGPWENGRETDSRPALSGRPVAELPSHPADPWVEIQITDTGIGMSEEVRKRIFDPFYTTKGGRGTGLGLSVVYAIIKRHGGHIVVRSARGQGTTVTLRFQKARRILEAEESGKERAAVPAPRRLLLVDDDPTVRSTLASMLRAAGHIVTEAEGGAAGIGLLEKSPVDLVVTDLGMPDVTGWDVARAVKSQIPKLPVVLLTGWGEQETGQPPAAGLVDRVLGKPVRVQELLAVIEGLTKKAK